MPAVDLAIQQLNQAVTLIIPEVILLATMCVMFLIGPFLVSEAGQCEAGLRHRWGALSLLAVATAWFVWFGSADAAPVFSGPFRVDALVWYTRGLSLTTGAALVLVLWNQTDDAHAAECHASLLAILAGVNFVSIANDLTGLFLALELVSIPTYLFLYLPRRNVTDREATIKYFLLSIFSSALVLYGMAWLYGVAGTTSIPGIREHFAAGSGVASGPVLIAMALLIAGLGFRIGAVPFHFYAPDVFQGVSAASSAMLVFVPKVVGFVSLLRLIPLMNGAVSLENWVPEASIRSLLAALAVVTMLVGNLMALRQKNVLRLMAFSSVAHAGYMLVGLALGDGLAAVGGPGALLFYLAAYGLMTIGSFALLSAAGTREHGLQTEEELAGLSRTSPLIALLLTVSLFSLTGLPPTVGFLGKLNLFLAAWGEGTPVGRILAVIMAANAAVAAWYYLRLITVMYLDPAAKTERVATPQPAAMVAGIACSVLTIVLFVAPQWLWDVVARAVS